MAAKKSKKNAVKKKTVKKKAMAKKPVTQKAVAKKAAPKVTTAKKAAPVKKATLSKKAAAPTKAAGPVKKTASVQEIVSPLDDRIIVSVADESGERKTASGLILVGAGNEGENIKGVVRAVGRGHLNKKGKIRPLDLKVGDEILFPKFAGAKVQVAGTEMVILRESEVLGVLN